MRGGLTARERSQVTDEKWSLGATLLEGANLRDVRLQGAELSFAQLQGVDLNNAKLQKANLGFAQLQGVSDEKYGPACLADVKWGNVDLAVIDWEPVKKLGDEGLAKQNKIRNGKVKKGKGERLREYREAVRANRQLAVALRGQGLNEEADCFAYRAHLLQRVVWRYQQRWLKYIFSWFLFLLAGYGYRPLWSFLWYLVIIFVFASAYYFLSPMGGHPFSPDGALVFSLTSFHGRGFFPGGLKLEDVITKLAASEAVVGLLIEISFIATFTQRFFGK
jgi:pentapeptide repeat protein